MSESSGAVYFLAMAKWVRFSSESRVPDGIRRSGMSTAVGFHLNASAQFTGPIPWRTVLATCERNTSKYGTESFMIRFISLVTMADHEARERIGPSRSVSEK